MPRNASAERLRQVFAGTSVPDTGVKIDVPILGSPTFYAEDFERLAEYIREA